MGISRSATGVLCQRARGAIFDVQAFDGKDIGGPPQFLREKKQRRGFLHLVRPPTDHWGEQLEFQQINCDQRAQDVQVRYNGMKITARRRPIENNRFQVLAQPLLSAGSRVPSIFLPWHPPQN